MVAWWVWGTICGAPSSTTGDRPQCVHRGLVRDSWCQELQAGASTRAFDAGCLAGLDEVLRADGVAALRVPTSLLVEPHQSRPPLAEIEAAHPRHLVPGRRCREPSKMVPRHRGERGVANPTKSRRTDAQFHRQGGQATRVAAQRPSECHEEGTLIDGAGASCAWLKSGLLVVVLGDDRLAEATTIPHPSGNRPRGTSSRSQVSSRRTNIMTRWSPAGHVDRRRLRAAGWSSGAARPPEFYDETFGYLATLGIECL